MPSDSTSGVVSGSRRRARGEAARTASVWVRLSPAEAAVVGEAAARAGMSVGAWVGETAVGRARAQAAGAEPGEAGGVGPSPWRELVAALVALRAEVAATRRPPELGSAVPAGELLDEQSPDPDPGGEDRDAAVRGGAVRDGGVGVLRRIDAVTTAVVDAALSSVRRSSPAVREQPGRS